MTSYTLEGFNQFLLHLADEHRDTLRQDCMLQIEDGLMKAPINYNRIKAQKIAQRLVLDGEDIQFNADDTDLAARINKLKLEANIPPQSYLLLSAPTRHSEPVLNMQQEADARFLQYKNFCDEMTNVFPGSKAKYYEVVTYQDLLTAIDEFLQSPESNSNISTVIFNGHGDTDGLVLHKEKASIAMKDFTDALIERLHKARAHKHNAYPRQVVVLFAQCYSHLYEGSDHDELEVVPLSSKDKECTTFSYVKKSEKVTSSHHDELDDYAAKQVEAQAENTH